jgi:hypothetical protein
MKEGELLHPFLLKPRVDMKSVALSDRRVILEDKKMVELQKI